MVLLLLLLQRLSHTWERAAYGLPELEGKEMSSTLARMRNRGDVALAEILDKKSPKARVKKMLELLLSLKLGTKETDARSVEYFTDYRDLMIEASFSYDDRLKKAIDYHGRVLGDSWKGEYVELRKRLNLEVLHAWAHGESHEAAVSAVIWMRDEYFLCAHRRKSEELVNHLLSTMKSYSARIRFEILTTSMCTLIHGKWAAEELFESLMLTLMQMRDRRMLDLLRWPHGEHLAGILEREQALMMPFITRSH